MILKYKNSNIHYTIEGEGEVVILLHGFLENVEMWNNLVPILSKNHLVISIDLLGHGKTECIGYLHTMEAMADAVFAVIKHLNVEKAHVVGHSMGGYAALALAEKQPQLFKGLCLMNSTFEADDEERKALRTRANKMAQNNLDAIIRMSFANLFAPASKQKFSTAYNTALKLALQTSLQGYIAAQEGMKLRPDRFEIYNKLNCNRLIIIGKKDSVIDGERLKSLIKDSNIPYKVLSEGHMSHIENISELAYILNHFIEN